MKLRKFADGGGVGSFMKQKVNRNKTAHGVGLEMPMASLKKFRGFAGGGEIERLAPKQKFGSAFAEARKAGADTFMWNGKKYTTELAKPKPVTPAKPSNMDARDRRLSDSGTSLNAYRGMAADEQAALKKRAPAPTPSAPSQRDVRMADAGDSGMDDEVSRLLKRAPLRSEPADPISDTFKRGGAVKRYAKGGLVRSRDGIAQRGKTKGRCC